MRKILLALLMCGLFACKKDTVSPQITSSDRTISMTGEIQYDSGTVIFKRPLTGSYYSINGVRTSLVTNQADTLGSAEIKSWWKYSLNVKDGDVLEELIICDTTRAPNSQWASTVYTGLSTPDFIFFPSRCGTAYNGNCPSDFDVDSLYAVGDRLYLYLKYTIR